MIQLSFSDPRPFGLAETIHCSEMTISSMEVMGLGSKIRLCFYLLGLAHRNIVEWKVLCFSSFMLGLGEVSGQLGRFVGWGFWLPCL